MGHPAQLITIDDLPCGNKCQMDLDTPNVCTNIMGIRTTVTLDDDALERVKRQSRSRWSSRETLNELGRRTLASSASARGSQAATAPVPGQTNTHRLPAGSENPLLLR